MFKCGFLISVEQEPDPYYYEEKGKGGFFDLFSKGKGENNYDAYEVPVAPAPNYGVPVAVPASSYGVPSSSYGAPPH